MSRRAALRVEGPETAREVQLRAVRRTSFGCADHRRAASGSHTVPVVPDACGPSPLPEAHPSALSKHAAEPVTRVTGRPSWHQPVDQALRESLKMEIEKETPRQITVTHSLLKSTGYRAALGGFKMGWVWGVLPLSTTGSTNTEVHAENASRVC